MMTAACRLCGALIQGSLLSPQAAAAQVGAEPEALDYQATIMELMRHMGKDHREYIETLAGTANTYHMHLVAKLAVSSDEAFNDQREAARRLVYWTLAGEITLNPVVPDGQKPVSTQ